MSGAIAPFPPLAPAAPSAGTISFVPHEAVRRRPRSPEPLLLFGLALAAYVALGAVLVFELDVVMVDAFSRLGNAYYALFSRDPHLAAVGFVWNPLHSLVTMPLLPLKALWPSLVADGFAANLVSAACMAGAVVQVRGALADLGVRRPARLVLTLLFAAHPMTVFYGANGMSEALFVLLLVTASRNLTRWLRDGSLGPLVSTGVALGFAYLTRYEALAAGACVGLLVAVTSHRRAEGDRRRRRSACFADLAIVGAPLALAFVGWAAASWLVVGHPFEHLSSQYANDSLRGAGATGAEGFSHVARQLLSLAPLLPVIAVLAAVASARRREALVLAPLAVTAPLLALATATSLTGSTVGWLRFHLPAVALAVLLVGVTIAPTRRRSPRPSPAGRMSTAALSAAMVGLLVPGLPSAASALMDPDLAREDHQLRVALGDAPPWEAGRGYDRRYTTEERVARHLDRLKLPEGAVLVDVALGFPIVLKSDNPRQFVITTDRDFAARLNDPQAFGVRYVLAVPPVRLGRVDAVNRAYPRFYDGGAGWAELAREFPNATDGDPAWRLYAVRRGSGAPRDG